MWAMAGREDTAHRAVVDSAIPRLLNDTRAFINVNIVGKVVCKFVVRCSKSKY